MAANKTAGRRLYCLLLLLLIAFCTNAQTRQITGKISDQKDGSPIPGATVSVKGTTLSTQSNYDGVFNLTVPANASTLIVSSVGYGSKEVAVSDNVSLSLSTSDAALSEVVVVGYGTKIKKDLTGSIARIKGDEVANTPVVNFNQALQGRAAGVFVESQSGKVGEGVKVRIRGAGSISASNEPLYVVDGVPINATS